MTIHLTRPPTDPTTPPGDMTLVPTADLKAVQSFFSLEGLEAGLSYSGTAFTQVELVDRLRRLCDDPDPKVQLAAIARLTAYIETCLKLNGRIATLTQKEKTNVGPASSVTRTAHTVTTISPPIPSAPLDTSLPPGATTIVDARPS